MAAMPSSMMFWISGAESAVRKTATSSMLPLKKNWLPSSAPEPMWKLLWGSSISDPLGWMLMVVVPASAPLT